jgi:hypothetical protein
MESDPTLVLWNMRKKPQYPPSVYYKMYVMSLAKQYERHQKAYAAGILTADDISGISPVGVGMNESMNEQNFILNEPIISNNSATLTEPIQIEPVQQTPKLMPISVKDPQVELSVKVSSQPPPVVNKSSMFRNMAASSNSQVYHTTNKMTIIPTATKAVNEFSSAYKI